MGKVGGGGHILKSLHRTIANDICDICICVIISFVLYLLL